MPLVVIPIRTETAVRGTSLANYWLIALNVAAFIVFDPKLGGRATLDFARDHLYFLSYPTQFHHFFTYQFLHDGFAHLLGNMVFLWVFGNSVCAKMRGGPYVLFYLACGVFAAWVKVVFTSDPFTLIGASGSIAGVTTAYLALFPRSYVTVLVWLFFFIQFFELPAMILIGLKIIVWDNMVAPNIGAGAEQVAYLAHLGGYFFGFLGALVMLLVRAVPRDQFDILALWGRWHRRRSWEGAQRSQVAPIQAAQPNDAELALFNQISDLRSRISDDLERRSTGAALELYEKLQAIGKRQCLPEAQQLEIAREYYRRGQYAAAAGAFEGFLQWYPEAGEACNVRLLLGIIHARDLRQFETAERLLTESLRGLRDDQRREQCRLWLGNVRAALGRAEPDLAH